MDYLQNSTDPQIGRLLDFLDALHPDWRANTLFVITSDHGRTDVTPHPEDRSTVARISTVLAGIGYPSSRARLANNNGMAHLYLRSRVGNDPWSTPPLYEDAVAVAQALFRDAALGSVVESILIRRNGAYRTYGETAAGWPDLSPVPQGSLIARLCSSRSGDLLLLLREGHYFLNLGKGSHHGSMHPLDLAVPLILAQGGIAPGWSEEPVSTTQVAQTIAGFLDIPMEGTAVSLLHSGLAKPPDNRRIAQRAARPGAVIDSR